MLGCIIQARMGSTRLPGKVMKNLDGFHPSIYFTIEQLKSCKLIDKIIVATTTNSEDDIIEDFVKNHGIDVFRGSSDDVLSRYYFCAKNFSLQTILRVTADCPLIDPDIVDSGISIYNKGDYDYVTNTDPRTYPDGNETEIFSMSALTLAYKKAVLPSEREHVTPYFRNNRRDFKIKNFSYNENLSNLRWTLDHIEDLELIKKILSHNLPRPIHIFEILKLFKENPNLKYINSMYHPNEGYEKSLMDDKKFIQNFKF